jgi:hypothetical protein
VTMKSPFVDPECCSSQLRTSPPSVFHAHCSSMRVAISTNAEFAGDSTSKWIQRNDGKVVANLGDDIPIVAAVHAAAHAAVHAYRVHFCLSPTI